MKNTASILFRAIPPTTSLALVCGLFFGVMLPSATAQPENLVPFGSLIFYGAGGVACYGAAYDARCGPQYIEFSSTAEVGTGIVTSDPFLLRAGVAYTIRVACKASMSPQNPYSGAHTQVFVMFDGGVLGQVWQWWGPEQATGNWQIFQTEYTPTTNESRTLFIEALFYAPDGYSTLALDCISIAPAVLERGLVAHYPFDGNANDASGNGNNGTPTNGVLLTTDRFGNPNSAFLFPGNGGRIEVPDSASLRPQQLTVAAWVNPSDTQWPPCVVSKRYTISTDPYNSFILDATWPTQPLFWSFCRTLNGAQVCQTGPAVITNYWSLLVGTDDQVRKKLYVNGLLVADQPSGGTLFYSSMPLYIGNVPFFDHGFRGKIDDVRIYNRALSATDVETLFSLGFRPAYVSNVKARQLSGTSTVDVTFDLAGNASRVLVAVSTNNGATFNAPASHLSGDGVLVPVAPASRRLLWDAGADLPGVLRQSCRVRVTPVQGGTNNAGISQPPFVLNTCSAPVGTLVGRVTAGGMPVPAAEASLKDTQYAVRAGLDGRFSLANIPPACGYQLVVAATGYLATRETRINVAAGITNLGDIEVLNASGVARLLPLSINPPTSEVEDGGVAHRYYRVYSEDFGHPLPFQQFQVFVGGQEVQQNDTRVLPYAATAGISDIIGCLRVVVPADRVPLGVTAMVQIVQNGNLKAEFGLRRKARSYDQVWKQKLNAGVTYHYKLADYKLGGSAESTLRRKLEGTAIAEESFTANRGFNFGAGFSLSTTDAQGQTPGKAKLPRLVPGLDVMAGLSATIAPIAGRFSFDAGSACVFPDPLATDSWQNALKLYLLYGEPLTGIIAFSPGVFDGFVEWAGERATAEQPTALWPYLQSVQGSTRATLSAEGEFVLGLTGRGNLPLALGGNVSGELSTTTIMGYAHNYKLGWDGRVWGAAGKSRLTADAGPLFGGGNNTGFAGYSRLDSAETETIAKVWREENCAGCYTQVDWSQKDLLRSAQGLELSVWRGLVNVGGSRFGPTSVNEVQETLSLTGFSFWGLENVSHLWQDVADGHILGSFRPWEPEGYDQQLRRGLLSYGAKAGCGVPYTRKVYQANALEPALGLGLEKLLAGLKISDKQTGLTWEQGVEAVQERGVYYGEDAYPLETYPPILESSLPVESWVDLQRRWALNAAGVINQAVNAAQHPIQPSSSTVIQAGAGAGSGCTLVFGQGTIPGGGFVGSSWTRTTATWPSGISPGGRQPKDFDPALPFLPTPEASNFVYGIGGVYRFESTNAFTGTGTLSIAYADADPVGFAETDLRMFRLDESNNRWVLIGGTVNAASNTVMATITDLGTYTLAPPLPTGELWLQPSTNTLAADGVSLLTVTVTNLLLSTGAAATQPWLFTVSVLGAELVNADADTNRSGVQVVSSNAALTLVLRAPVGGTYGQVTVASVAGDAHGQIGFNLLDTAAPATPANVAATAGQSRLWVSWHTNAEPDLAGYRVRYRAGAAGPPWDGTAAVEGQASPVTVSGTNVLLRGLADGTNYFLAVSAVDAAGNESALSAPVQVQTTVNDSPAAPTGVAVRFGADGTNILMWALSEDDGYNDRDVVRYDVWRAVLPGGAYVKVGEAAAGVGLFAETNTLVGATQYVRYAVTTVDDGGLASALALANRVLPSGTSVDNDGDGMADDWERAYGLSAENPSDALTDADGDALTNLREYQLGRNPLMADRPYFISLATHPNGALRLAVEDLLSRKVDVEVSSDLSGWGVMTNFNGLESAAFEDSLSNLAPKRFYRAVVR